MRKRGRLPVPEVLDTRQIVGSVLTTLAVRAGLPPLAWWKELGPLGVTSFAARTDPRRMAS